MYKFYNILGYLSLFVSIVFVAVFYWLKTLNLLGVILIYPWFIFFLCYTVCIIPIIYIVWIKKSVPSLDLIAYLGFLSWCCCIVWVFFMFFG